MNKSKPEIKNELTLKIKVEPRSSKAGIVGQYGDALKVKLTSPPVEGKANKELIEILAKEFCIARKDVEIISGQSSKNKIVKLYGVKSIKDGPEKWKSCFYRTAPFLFFLLLYISLSASASSSSAERGDVGSKHETPTLIESL